MRVAILVLVVALFGAGDAAAEKVKTNQSTKVYSHPGEHGKVLVKLKSGQNMTVLAKEGRWLKVRVQGRTGYVARSKVDLPDDDELVRNTRRRAFVDGRGTKRGFGGETGPDDRVGADATGDGADDSDNSDTSDKPDKSDKSDKADKADKGDSDDSDDSDSKPAKSAKAAKAEKSSKSKKAKSDDDDEDDKPSKAKKAKSDDDKPSKAKKAKAGDDSDDEDDEDTVVVDDAKTGEPDDTDTRPTAHVSEKTKVLNDPADDSDEAFVAKPDTVLYPAESKGKWTRVENDDGDTGWVPSDSLDVEDSGGGGGGGSSHARAMDIHARLGVMFMSQSMKGTGGTAAPAGSFNPDNYSVGSSAIALALGGELLYPYKKNYVVGGEATLDYAKTLLGGIHIPMTTNTTSADTAVSLAIFNVRGMIGYDLKKKNGMMLFGRLGIRYQSFMVDGYDNLKQNPAMLPQETIAAPTLGGALAIPKLTDKVGLTVTLDLILAGASVSQTAGYQDGTSPSAKAAFLGGVVRYKWKPDMDFQGTYNLDYTSLDFGKPSADPMLNQRGHTATDVTRTDMNHIVTFGIIKGF